MLLSHTRGKTGKKYQQRVKNDEMNKITKERPNIFSGLLRKCWRSLYYVCELTSTKQAFICCKQASKTSAFLLDPMLTAFISASIAARRYGFHNSYLISHSVGISNLWIVNEQVNKLCLFSDYYWCYHECNLHSSIGIKNAEKQAEWNKRKEVLLDTSSYQMHFQN